MIQVTINGENHELPDEMPLSEYVSSLHVNPQTVAVARNGEVLRRDEWETVIVLGGDTLEIVRAVGGG